ncbi:WD repeat-containing protein 76-like isoform X2 [Engraulis encrasicolus]
MQEDTTSTNDVVRRSARETQHPTGLSVDMKDKLDCVVKVHLVQLNMAPSSPGNHRHMQEDTTSTNDVVRRSARETQHPTRLSVDMKDKLDCVVKVHLVRLNMAPSSPGNHRHMQEDTTSTNDVVRRSARETQHPTRLSVDMKDKLDCVVKVHLVRLNIAPPSPGHHRHMQEDTTSTNDVVRRSARAGRAPPSEGKNHNQVDTSFNNDVIRRSARTQRPIRYFVDSDDGDDDDDSDYSDDHDDSDDSEPKRKRRAVKGGTGSTKYGAPLSEYELERLENIRQSKAFLSSLNLLQLADMMRPKSVPRKKVVREALPPRKSLRLQNIDVDVPESEEELILEGPVPMCPLNLKDGSSLPEELVRLWTEEPVKQDRKWKGMKMDLESYKEGLQKMGIQEDGVAKVVQQIIFSAAFHPCDSSLLMAAGDLWGKVGIWNPEASWGDNGVLIFRPHTRQITSMKFSNSQPSTLITTSADETVRAGDVERATFDEVCRFKDVRSFDFLSDDCTTLLLGNKWGRVTICDMRTRTSSHESFYAMDPFSKKIMRCVHVHPVHRMYFLAAGINGVRIHDVRYLKKESNQAVSDLRGEAFVSGAYFSPDTGNRVLGTCNDDTLRVFDTSQMISSPPLITTIPHSNLVKSWPNIQAMWDPKQDDCFAVGCIGSPPRIKVFHESGELLHTFEIPHEMATGACNIVAFHPTRFALLGGNSRSRLHVFT